MKDFGLILFCLPSSLLVSGILCAGEEPAKVADAGASQAATVDLIRIKDLAELQGVRENQLIGNGLVIGLDGTGDKNSTLASQELANMALRFGVKVTAKDLKSKNIAAVMVTAQLPAFIKKGARIDVQVSSIGDAKSLQGGILIQTPLVGADGQIYAAAQGALSIGGFSAGGDGAGGATVQKNHPLVGRVPEGALIEREVPSDFVQGGVLRLRLRKPDFTTAQRMTDAINERWGGAARALDLSCVEVRVPSAVLAEHMQVAFVSELERLTLTPDTDARVVINERTGTVVAGANVRIAPTAVSHGGIFITVKNSVSVSQPAPISEGQTMVVPDQNTVVTEELAHVVVLEQGPTLGELARALNALKVTPRDIIAIFQALKDAGALHAKLIIM